MSLPTEQELDDRAKKAQEKLERFNHAYTKFIESWDEIKDDENQLVFELAKFVDKTKIHSILTHINNLK